MILICCGGETNLSNNKKEVTYKGKKLCPNHVNDNKLWIKIISSYAEETAGFRKDIEDIEKQLADANNNVTFLKICCLLLLFFIFFVYIVGPFKVKDDQDITN